MTQKKIKVKVTLNQDTCIACGTCGSLMPEAFELDNSVGKYKVTENYKLIETDEETFKKLKEAADMCPTQSITVEKIKD